MLYQNQEEVFAKDFLHLIVQIDGKSVAEPDLFEQYYKRSELSRVFEHLSDRDSPPRSAAAQTDTPRMKVKKTPAVFETMHETCRRLAFLRDFKSIAQHSTEAIVLGGSLSYGKFYNVRAIPISTYWS